MAKAGQVPDSNSDASFDEAWTEVRGNEDIQFTPAEMPEPAETPQWWLDFLEWLGEIFTPVGQALAYSWPVLKYVLLVMLIAGALALIWIIISPYIDDWRGRVRKPDAPDEWRPEEKAARKWLDEADALAKEGRYEEAAHLLYCFAASRILNAADPNCCGLQTPPVKSNGLTAYQTRRAICSR